MKNQLKKCIIILSMIMAPLAYSQSYCDSNPVDIHGNLSVSGNKIVDQNNSAVSFAGNSLFWSNTGWGAEKYYNADAISSLKDDWNTTIVRAAMGVEDNGGYLSDATNKDRVKTVVDAAIAEGLYVIIDWHSHGAENYESQAVGFFEEMASLYGNYPNVIYEIYNEPIYSSWSNDIKPYAETVIAAIRAIDNDNLIIVGTPTWSQDVDIASNDPITSSTNIAYTLHFYAGTHFDSLRAKAQTALNNGIALMVTEWGTVSASGDGSVNYDSTNDWMDFLEENDISHLNWSINDKSEGASVFNSGASSTGGWSDSDLTESGSFVKTIIEGWSEYCDGEPIDPIIVEPTEYVSIPAKIEAEDYDTQSGTQSEDTSDVDGDINIGYIDADDFLTYNINVPNSGEYTIDFRVASRTTGTNFDIYSETTLIGNISSEATGGWQAWETVSETVSLTEGDQTIKLVATTGGWNINWLEFTQNDDNNTNTTTYFIPDTSKKYYIDVPVHNLRLAATGSSEEPYTTSTSTTGDNVEWVFVAKGNGYWHIQLAAGGNLPRLRSDNTSSADMQATSSSGGYTYYEMADEDGDGTYFLTLPDGPANYKRLQVNNSGEVLMVTENNDGSWESFIFTEAAEDTNTVSSGCSDLETWSDSAVYEEGSQIVYENNIYENKWYSLNHNPVTYSVNSWDVWTFIGSCDSAKSTTKSSVEQDLINVFHNSSTNNLNIYIGDLTNYSDATILDIQGRIIYSQKLSNQNASEISLEGYKNGIYILKLSGAKNYTKTFLKK